MQSYQLVRERKINKAHREIISRENDMEITNDKVSIPSEKKKGNHPSERKRKRISAQNEIIIPNMDEKFSISTNVSSLKKSSMEPSEVTNTTKPKKVL